MTEASAVCTGFWWCLHAYQTFAAGALALLAGIVTALGVWYATHMQVRAQERHRRDLQKRRRLHSCIALSDELQTLSRRANQALGTIRNIRASKKEVSDRTKERIYLAPPPVIADWEPLSLLPNKTMKRCQRILRRISDHNHDIARSGSFAGSDDFSRSLIRRLDKIRAEANSLAAELSNLEEGAPE